MRKPAFTLIELLVVIVIIAILTSIATASYLKAQSRSRDSVRKSAVNTISTAVEAFYSVNKSFPGDAYKLGESRVPSSSVYNICEEYSHVNDNGTLGTAPNYVYVPGQDCSSSLATSGDSTYFAYNPTDYLPKGTWIPGLGTYLNPIPAEPHFANVQGTSSTVGSYSDPYDILSSVSLPETCYPSPNSCGRARQLVDQSRTLNYRSLSTGYLVYARLEADTDADFTNQFAPSLDNMCLPPLSGVIQPPPELSCVPTASSTSTNPMIVYLIRK